MLLRPALGLGHELAVAGLAWLAHTLISGTWWAPLVDALKLDPIYAGAAIRSLGGVDVIGLAVADPVGGWLNSLAPTVFQAPSQVSPEAGVSMVATPGTPALGRGLASLGADVVWLMIGIAMFWRWRRGRWPLALLGLLIQAQIAVNHLFGAPINLRDLDATGLPFAVALALPSLSRDAWFTTALGQLPAVGQDIVVGGVLLLVGYACALGLFAPVRLAARAFARGHRAAAPRWSGARPSVPLARFGALAAVVVAISPIGALAFGTSNWNAGGDLAHVARAESQARHRHARPGSTARSADHGRERRPGRIDARWRLAVSRQRPADGPSRGGLQPAVREARPGRAAAVCTSATSAPCAGWASIPSKAGSRRNSTT